MTPPLRKVLYIIAAAPDRQHADTVMLECRHEGKATGSYARCTKCGYAMQQMFPSRRKG
jgi:hypothetical protein